MRFETVTGGVVLPSETSQWSCAGAVMLIFAASSLSIGLSLGYGALGWTVTAGLLLLSIASLAYRSGREIRYHPREARRWTWYRGHVVERAPLPGLTRVRVRHEVELVQKEGQTSLDCFQVRLEGAGPSYEVGKTGDTIKARQLAELLSAGLELPCHDGQSKRNHDELNVPLVERVKLRQEPVPRPPRLAASYDHRPDFLRVLIPPLLSAPRGPKTVLAVGGALFGMVFGYIMFSEDVGLWSIPIGASGALVLAGADYFKTLGASRHREQVRVTSTHLEVGTSKIPLSELEELTLFALEQRAIRTGLEQYYRHGYLWARSDRAELRFGGALSREELEYLKEVLEQEIARRFQS